MTTRRIAFECECWMTSEDLQLSNGDLQVDCSDWSVRNAEIRHVRCLTRHARKMKEGVADSGVFSVDQAMISVTGTNQSPTIDIAT